MKTIAFKFALPGKKPGDDKSEDKAPTDDKDDKSESKDDDESEGYTKAELGKMVASAMRSGDGEAIWEALHKFQDCTPTDANE